MINNQLFWKRLVVGLPFVWLAIFSIFFYLNWTTKVRAVDFDSDFLFKTASSSALIAPVVVPPRIKPARQVAKGIYLTANSANNSKKMDEMIRLLDRTELNAVVIDIKDYTGYILYDSQIPAIKELKTNKAEFGMIKKGWLGLIVPAKICGITM